MLESFAGVDPYDFFMTGNLVNPRRNGFVDNTKLFRDMNLLEIIQCAERIRFQVYNWEKTTVISEVIFSGVGDSVGWFAYENVVSSSFWVLQPPTYANGNIASIEGKDF